MDALTALRLQIAWGADEALADMPVNRLRPATLQPLPAAVPATAGEPPRPTTPAEQARDRAARAETLAALREVIVAFTACPLRDTAASTVFAEGDPASALMLIGEAPSAEDDRAGRPFTGAAGDYLDQMLASIGLDRSRLLLTPLIPWRPPAGRTPSAREIATCLPFLHRLIELSAPRLVVLAGALATRTLLSPDATRRQARTRWHDLVLPGGHRVRALPTFSPAALAKTPSGRRDAWRDLRALKRGFNAMISGI